MKYKMAAALIPTIACAGAALAEQLADPTRPVNARAEMALSSSEPQALRVEAIMHCEQRRLAIINGALVHEGERIAGALVETISEDAVHYLRNGRRQRAALNKTTLQVRRTAAQGEK